ncbi:MAG: tetratricopeptide repeat protein [Desulfuromonadales bacterium]|nr:MAG: tetratricopeptide repeat protein [Desulfuromonadales bacterium]
MVQRTLKKSQVPDAVRTALALHQRGELAAAEELYRQILRLEPKNSDVLHLLGLIRDAGGFFDRAIELIEKAVRISPDFAVYRNSLGVVLRKAGRFAEAKRALEKALALRHDYAEAHNNMGNLLRQMKQPQEALSHFERAVALQPENPFYHNNRAGALCDAGRLCSAVESFERAISLKPDYLEACTNVRGVYTTLGLHRKAYDITLKIMGMKCIDAATCSDCLMGLNYLSDCSQEEITRHHLAYGMRFGAPSSPVDRRFPNLPVEDRKLRIGYVSPDFHRHPVAYYLEPVLKNHDHERFEIFCYYTNDTQDEYTDRLKSLADSWLNSHSLSDDALAGRIATDGIDILIDLAGHTAHNRLPLFASRPAPVQATWLGYFNTTGMKAIDYLIADRIVVRDGEEGMYAEKVVRLPESRFCYQPPAGAPEVAPSPSRRSGVVTFGSFNNLSKLSPPVIEAWAQLLKRVENSRLLLKWNTLGFEEARLHYAGLFREHGIGSERLLLQGFSSHGDMLAEYSTVDIALDPFPFCGGVTTCEALWMGVPVITLAADRPAGRQTASFLSILGRDDLVAANPEEYVDIGARLAGDERRLAALRSTLRESMASSPLCDGKRFTLGLERLYLDMWRTWCEAADMR